MRRLVAPRPSRIAGPDARSDARRRGAGRARVPGEHVHHGGSDGAEGRGRRLGPFVVVWQSGSYYGNGPDGYGYGVAARRFDAAGTPAGAEFVVNTYTAGPQESPAVAAAPGGDFLVAWQGGDFRFEQDGSASGVFVQRFAGSGARVGQELRGNTVVRGFQGVPRGRLRAVGRRHAGVGERILRLPTGWRRRGLRDFRPALRRGRHARWREFQVNTFTSGNRTSPAVAADPAGGFVVVWESGGYTSPKPGRQRLGIFGQRLDAAAAPVRGEFQVNTFTTGMQGNPAVASIPTGGSWSSGTAGNYGAGGQDRAAMACSDGDSTCRSPVGDEFQVNTTRRARSRRRQWPPTRKETSS